MKNFLKIVLTAYLWVVFAHKDASFAADSSLPEICECPFSRRTYVEDRQNHLGPNHAVS